MEGKVAKENRITEGSIFGQLLLFFFPILFGTFFQQLYNTADAMIVGGGPLCGKAGPGCGGWKHQHPD